MIYLRVFSEIGNEEFQQYIQNLKNIQQVVRKDLNVEPYSFEFRPFIEIDETKVFRTRMEMGKYLKEIFDLNSLTRSKILDNKGLWTWLAYLWFEQICPVNPDGMRKIREPARYIRSSHYSDYLRHYVAGAYEIYDLHGENNSKLFLESPPFKIADMVDAVALGGQDIISSKSLIEVAHRLYWDRNLNHPKRGIGDKNKPGNPRRFVKFIKQIQLTYDLHHQSMTSEQIIALLPSEFNGWLVLTKA
jgi:hypothetical protein